MGYGGHQLRLKCAQVHHQSPAGTFSRVPGRCLHWSPNPPQPRWPPAVNIILIWYNIIYFNLIYNMMSHERSFSFVQTFHTHTPCLWQGGVRAHEVKMRMRRGMMMRWKWRWDERLLNRDPRRGTQKKREGANPHQHTWPGAGKRWKGKKNGGRRTRNKTSGGGGEDGSAWTNLTQRKPTPTSARAGPNLPREGRTHEIGDQMPD